MKASCIFLNYSRAGGGGALQWRKNPWSYFLNLFNRHFLLSENVNTVIQNIYIVIHIKHERAVNACYCYRKLFDNTYIVQYILYQVYMPIYRTNGSIMYLYNLYSLRYKKYNWFFYETKKKLKISYTRTCPIGTSVTYYLIYCRFITMITTLLLA